MFKILFHSCFNIDLISLLYSRKCSYKANDYSTIFRSIVDKLNGNIHNNIPVTLFITVYYTINSLYFTYPYIILIIFITKIKSAKNSNFDPKSLSPFVLQHSIYHISQSSHTIQNIKTSENTLKKNKVILQMIRIPIIILAIFLLFFS